MILADKIIENRKKNGWSQEELAEKLGVSRQSVSKWEGAQSMPDMKKILQLAEIFDVSTDYLLKDEIEEAGSSELVPVDRDLGEEEVRSVSMEEANAYLTFNERAARMISTAVYLGWSFITQRWDFTWIVWPVAGVLFAAYREIMKAMVRRK